MRIISSVDLFNSIYFRKNLQLFSTMYSSIPQILYFRKNYSYDFALPSEKVPQFLGFLDKFYTFRIGYNEVALLDIIGAIHKLCYGHFLVVVDNRLVPLFLILV